MLIDPPLANPTAAAAAPPVASTSAPHSRARRAERDLRARRRAARSPARKLALDAFELIGGRLAGVALLKPLAAVSLALSSRGCNPPVSMLGKDWDDHVVHAEEIARTAAFQDLRDRILAQAAPRPRDVVVDVGVGTGLLTLAIAPSVRQVWAIDIAPRMTEYVRVKAASQQLENVTTATASAVSLPLADGIADLVLSNYCFHHLSDEDKRRALAEAHRVLAPGGRLVVGDMMFRIGVAKPRDRRVLAGKVRLLLARGVPGVIRLVRGVLRQLGGRGERPAAASWWTRALEEGGFEHMRVEVLGHEGGIATAVKPAVRRLVVQPSGSAQAADTNDAAPPARRAITSIG